MGKRLLDLKLMVVGGDGRELLLIEELATLGVKVFVVGYDLIQLPKNLLKTDLKAALPESDAIILPMSGVDEEGKVKAVFAKEPIIFKDGEFRLIKKGTPVLTGVASSYLKEQRKKFHLNIVETAELDEIAIYNSIPTAEGAIEIAIHEMAITLHGSNALILGFGKIGMTLARMLKGIGSKVSVTARKTLDLARIEEQGHEALTYETLHETIDKMDVIFNTVPSLVLTRNLLELLKPEIVIIDLATKPGGTDFLVANQLGLKAIHALGLPGKTAPLTAGKILSKAYPKLILKEIEVAAIKGGVK